MNKKIALLASCLVLILGNAFYSLDSLRARAASYAGTTELVFYDAASGTIPSPPLLSFTGFPPGEALPTYLDGATVLDTTRTSNDTYAGWTATGMTTPGFPILDRTAGYQVNYTVQLDSESHRRDDRAGFSIIILSQDAWGIELAFWQNQIWAQSDESTGGLFNHGEGVAFDTVTDLVDYQVTIVGETYTLTANRQPILSGPLRDYSKFDGFPDPYETPNFLFLGDNTTSAQARVRLRFLSVTGTEPVTPTSTITSTSTSLPTASLIPLPSATPAPTPTSAPAGRAFELCPSGWLLAMMAGTMLIRKSKAGL